MNQHVLTPHASARAALVVAAVATLIAVSTGFADQGNGQGNGNGNGQGNGPKHSAAEVTSLSPQPTPTAQSPQPTPTALSPQPTPTAQATQTGGQVGGQTQDKQGDKGESGGANSLEHRHGISGYVLEKGQNWLRIETASGLKARVMISSETEVRGRGNEELELGDIEAGDRVNVQGDPTEQEGDATLEARRIRVHAEDTEDEGVKSAADEDEDSEPGRGRGRGRGQGRGPKD